jgi:hypothetical protein
MFGRYGNGIAAVLFGGIFLFALIRGEFGFAVLALLVTSLAVFNLYVAEQSAVSAPAEEPEQWARPERREPDLRTALSRFSGESPEKILRHHGL